MKSLLLIVLSLLLIVGCSKSINEETLIDKDGLKYHPETIELYSGKVFQDKIGDNQEFEGSYKAGKKDGLQIWRYNNGQKKEEANYRAGKKDGLITWWYENGQKKCESTYKAGKKDGLITWWYENGLKNCEGTYRKGKQVGLWTLWYENGQKMWEQTFKNGKSISSKEWYINGSFKG